MKKYCMIFLLLLLSNIILAQKAQTITIDVDIKDTGNRVYELNPGSGKRAVIDLGHFNSNMGSVNNIKLATITVTIDINDKLCTEGSNGMDISTIDLEKLKSFTFSDYDVTKFLGTNNGSMQLRVKNLSVLSQNTSENGKIYIGCRTSDIKHFKYQFDLVVDLKSLDKESMYGFSPKDNDNSGYLNIKDIILEQIRYIGN